MIRVLVVDDDFRVADLHGQFVTQLPGFELVGTAMTAADAVAQARRLRPDLVLLDQYLPDGLGTSIVPRLSCDVMMLTAAADTVVVRAALVGGVVNYLVKPFTEADLANRLQAYGRFRAELAASRALGQPDIDRAMHTLHEGDRSEAALRKGRSRQTATLVVVALRRSQSPVTAAALAEQLGLSRTTTQRYLSDLAAEGRVTVSLRYGSTGRPEHLYRWRRTPHRANGDTERLDGPVPGPPLGSA